jgi:hypothetical protein
MLHRSMGQGVAAHPRSSGAGAWVGHILRHDGIDRHAAQQLITRVTFNGYTRKDSHFDCCETAQGSVNQRFVDLIHRFIDLILVWFCRVLRSVLRCVV